MSKENKKIKNIFDQQRANLPDGFWEKLESNIPEYKQKKNRFLGLPLWGCLGVFFIISLAAIISYSVFKINETTNMVDRAFESVTKNSKLRTKPSEVLVSEIDSTTVRRINSENSTESSSEKNKQNNTKNTTNSTTNAQTISEVKTRNTTFNETRIQQINKDKKPTTKESQPQTLNARSSFETGANASTILPITTKNIAEVDNKQENLMNASRVNTDGRNVDILSDKKNDNLEDVADKIIDPITALFAFVTTNKELVKMEYTKVENQEIVFERNTFLEGGYNTVFAQRTITSDTRNSWRSNKTKFEKDFISHEGYVNYGKYLNKNIYLIGGLRYTVIKELFDYSYDTISTENFSFMKGKRSIKHTNKLHMLDASIGIGAEYTINKFTFGSHLGLSYNLLFVERGIGLNNNDLLQRIEDSNLYTNNTGLALNSNLYMGYALRSNIELKLNAGVRNYLKDFSSGREGLPIGFWYKAIHVGGGVRYLF